MTCSRGSTSTSYAKTSGSKGLQVYVPLNTPHTHEHASSFALAVAQVLEKAASRADRHDAGQGARKDKVLIDWSQNSRHKTTICVVLAAGPPATHGVDARDLGRGRRRRPAATPLSFETDDVLARIDEHGDLFAGTLTLEQRLPVSG